jgi:hypothetical protein
MSRTTQLQKPAAIALVHEHTPELRLMLVYQAGIANVFQVDNFTLTTDDRQARRIYQGDFRTAEQLCYGAALAGAIVRSAACNMAGDIQRFAWTDDLEAQPFSDCFNPQTWNGDDAR